ncbi:MAG: FAD-binding oxidoreductase [Gammaproteobacteria bacterium]|jgi:sarcosine oxidase subunit beta|nr:FAD-binding oxidoreductase [Gammaproteobacteria bacterium]
MAKMQKLLQYKEPGKSYDVVIIGGGLHGLATAYYLARYHKVGRIAVLERRYIGFGGSGRNTEMVRANKRAHETLPFYKESLEMWDGLSAELEWNLMVQKKGLIALAHSDFELASMRMMSDSQRRAGIKIDMLSPSELKKMIPSLDTSDKPALPIFGAQFHPEGGTVHHDAAVWGYAMACARYGVDICVGVDVTGINIEGERVTGVETNVGTIAAGKVHAAVGGYSSEIGRMIGMKFPVTTIPMQVMTTDIMQPFLDYYVASPRLHFYTQQTLKGDLILGGPLDHFQSWNSYTTYEESADRAFKIMEYFPDLAHVRIVRTWSGLCDCTGDSAPVMGGCGIDGLSLDIAWGYYGFKSVPASGKYSAEYIATDQMPEKIKAFGLDRFYTRQLVREIIL